MASGMKAASCGRKKKMKKILVIIGVTIQLLHIPARNQCEEEIFYLKKWRAADVA